ncbi:MAG: hypothetical protein AVDCRST_MAG86-1601 [uncultured Truepera sp.]|uniref:DUF4440 domain-containing protein n=1 Tax=uncultured Truepera sp. TaxID=543023 RepID=A0A6J4V6Z1_9DEIN|nr:MAG: hypothetical protein AVDCRST_MAG86-1601 [uncultured Truepera sp.]
MPNVGSNTLEAPVRELVEASNTEDQERFLAAFAADATLTDFGRTFAGQGEIGSWSDAEHIGVRNQLAVTGVTRSEGGDVVTLSVFVSGGGFNGPGTFTLLLSDDRAWITHLKIAP